MKNKKQKESIKLSKQWQKWLDKTKKNDQIAFDHLLKGQDIIARLNRLRKAK